MTRTTNTMIRSICRDPSAVYKKGGDAFFGQKHMKRQELLTYLRACEKQQIHPDFSGKDLTGTDFSGTCLDHTDFTGADLTGSRLRRVKADFADFSRTIWDETDAVCLSVHSCRFSGISAKRADFSGAAFRNESIFNTRYWNLGTEWLVSDDPALLTNPEQSCETLDVYCTHDPVYEPDALRKELCDAYGSGRPEDYVIRRFTGYKKIAQYTEL